MTRVTSCSFSFPFSVSGTGSNVGDEGGDDEFGHELDSDAGEEGGV